MRSVDDIIKSSETQKRIDINPQLWDRVEEKLDQRDLVKKKNRQIWMVAASMAFVMVSAIGLLRYNTPQYQVEDLINTNHPLLSNELINQLNSSIIYQDLPDHEGTLQANTAPVI